MTEQQIRLILADSLRAIAEAQGRYAELLLERLEPGVMPDQWQSDFGDLLRTLLIVGSAASDLANEADPSPPQPNLN